MASNSSFIFFFFVKIARKNLEFNFKDDAYVLLIMHVGTRIAIDINSLTWKWYDWNIDHESYLKFLRRFINSTVSSVSASPKELWCHYFAFKDQGTR